MPNLDLRAFNVDISNGGRSDDGSLPKRIKVLSWGTNSTTDGPVYLNDISARVFSTVQKESGRDKDVALDFDHCTVPGSKEYVKGKPKSIAAYGDPELVNGDGLYLNNLEWTPMGEKNAQNYKDLSPACVVDEDGVVRGLHSVALTPNGAVYGLKFFSAPGFDDMIKHMATENNTKTMAVSDADYNVKGANPSLKKEGDKFELETHPMDADEADLSADDDNEVLKKNQDPKDEDSHPDDCSCARCMCPGYVGAADEWSQSEHSAHKGLVKDFAEDDHYSKYGDVKYADETLHKYPIDTDKHVRAALSYINIPKNAKKEAGRLSEVKSKIDKAAEKFGIKIGDDSKKETKTKPMSANDAKDRALGARLATEDDSNRTIKAYKTQPWQYSNMNNTIKEMAALVKMEGESDTQKVLDAFLAKYKENNPEYPEQITKKDNSEIRQFSAEFKSLQAEVEALKTKNAEDLKRHEKSERQTILLNASREGKIIPLSADEAESVSLDVLRSIVSKVKKDVVPTVNTLRTMSVQDGANKTNKQKAQDAIRENIKQQMALSENK
jgi:phage I-like protein